MLKDFKDIQDMTSGVFSTIQVPAVHGVPQKKTTQDLSTKKFSMNPWAEKSETRSNSPNARSTIDNIRNDFMFKTDTASPEKT